MPQGGSRDLTAAQLDRHSSAGRGLVRACQTHPFHARPTQPRCSAPCRGGEKNFIVESGKAALAIPHFGLMFVYAPKSWKSSKRKIHPAPLWPRRLSVDSPTRPDALSTDTNKSTVSGFNQLHKFNPPSMEKNKPQAPPKSPPPAGSTSHPALAPAYKPLLAVPALLTLPGEQPQLLLP